ncbi:MULTISPECIES: transposase [Xenorhabdus]|uniref:transposase n=1 Tax=Xenorhabdus TaxID=626 RepID=UPI000649A5BB|nr:MULTISPECIES: transposase [Xenorhabdus]KLU15929.1 hypothetical protein AAY47_08585 [Xenorhabdus griffiniae]KOP34084.1 hypothetical protein AFK69_06810 [Xenorhabdus sp. GDc328]
MKRYSPEKKRAMQKKMLPPYNISISSLAKSEGISKSTLIRWRKEALTQIKIQHLQNEQTLIYRDKTPSEKNIHEGLQFTIKTIIKI